MFGSVTESFMAPAGVKDVGRRPSPLRLTRSFPRSEGQEVSITVNRTHRASTIQNGAAPDAVMAARQRGKAAVVDNSHEPDTFETSQAEVSPAAPPRASVDMEDLPIELVSLTDRY